MNHVVERNQKRFKQFVDEGLQLQQRPKPDRPHAPGDGAGPNPGSPLAPPSSPAQPEANPPPSAGVILDRASLPNLAPSPADWGSTSPVPASTPHGEHATVATGARPVRPVAPTLLLLCLLAGLAWLGWRTYGPESTDPLIAAVEDIGARAQAANQRWDETLRGQPTAGDARQEYRATEAALVEVSDDLAALRPELEVAVGGPSQALARAQVATAVMLAALRGPAEAAEQRRAALLDLETALSELVDELAVARA